METLHELSGIWQDLIRIEFDYPVSGSPNFINCTLPLVGIVLDRSVVRPVIVAAKKSTLPALVNSPKATEALVHWYRATSPTYSRYVKRHENLVHTVVIGQDARLDPVWVCC